VPVETTLMHNKRVLLVIYRGDVTDEDVHYTIKQYVEACQQSTFTVHSINDARQMNGVPFNILALFQSPTNPLQHPNRGKAIVITTNELLRAKINSVSRLAPDSQFQCVRSLDEAWALMQRILAQEDVVTEE
jgi:hypothetical protein